MSNFIDADYAAIEARIVNWLAGQEDVLCEYRVQDAAKTKEEKKLRCRYRIMASQIYGILVPEVLDFPHRFVGKQGILSCGFQGGVKAFIKACLQFGYKEVTKELAELVVSKFRTKHKSVVKYWYAVEEAAKSAILKKNETFKPIPKHRKGESFRTPLPKFADVRFLCKDVGGMPYLLIRLPSGRRLAYPRPRVIPSTKFEGGTSIQFFGHILGTKWGHVDTYGGKLVENITQAVAADIMANGVHQTEKRGYETATLIHDQCISFFRPERGQSVEEFVKLLTTLPEWADGLPIAAEGAIVPFYKKD